MTEQVAKVNTFPSTFARDVAANIRAEAARRNINQSQMAAALGIARSAVSERWRGVRQWQLEDIEKAADLFGLPPYELCANRDSNPEPAD